MKKSVKLAAFVLILAMALVLCGCASSDYKEAVKLAYSGNYAQASEMFTALGDYKDSAALALDCNYRIALSLYENGSYTEAAEAFTALGDYQQSAAYLEKANNALAEQAVVGRWMSSEIDVTDQFLSGIKSSIANSADAAKLLEYCNFSSFTVKLSIELTENNTFALAEDSDSVAASFEKVCEEFTIGIKAYTMAMLTQSLEEEGFTVEQLMEECEVTTEDELIKTVLGVTAEEFTRSVLNVDMITEAAVTETCGTYSFKDGQFVLSVGTESEIYVYDAQTDTLTGSDSSLNVENISFSRVKE